MAKLEEHHPALPLDHPEDERALHVDLGALLALRATIKITPPASDPTL